MIPAPEASDDKWGPRRARLVAACLALVFTAIVGRSAQVAFSGPEGGADDGGKTETARRADIVDRNGDLLSTSLPAWSLSADPRAIWDADDVAGKLASVLPGLSASDLSKKLSDRNRHFVWIQRGLTPRQRQSVFALRLEGLRFEEEMIRVYPGGKLAGHLLGYTNVDGKGVEGLERLYEARLAKGEEPLKLTIDAGVQFALESELDRAAEDYIMKGAAGVVMDASTGAVRAIASWPVIDPNRQMDYPADARTNRALNSVFELGSIFKPLTVAAAIEGGVLAPTDTFDVATPFKIGATSIRDVHPMEHPKAVTPTDILAFSSNIGAAKIGLLLTTEQQQQFLGKVGLLSRADYEGPKPAAPLIPRDWSELTRATVSYGHGVAVAPLAFAAAFTPFATGGEYIQPAFIEPIDPRKSGRSRVMSAETARIVTAMMRDTVVRGTGKLAEAPGYEVAGKTGTAEKPTATGYDPDKNVTSFAAVFPASRPQYVVLIVLDEAQPRTGEARTAAYTAASIAGRLIARAAPMLDVEPVFPVAGSSEKLGGPGVQSGAAPSDPRSL